MQGGISLPSQIQKKHACVTVQNFDDDLCFKWAILSTLHPVHNSDRVSSYKIYENELNFNGIQFPMSLKQIPKFEKQNHISVNVYTLKKSSGEFKILPLHITPCKKETHINHLLLQNYYIDDEENKQKENIENNLPISHYVWIKDLSRLVSTQLSKRDGRKFCDRCLYYFRSDSKLNLHEQDCSQLNKCKVTLPTPKDNILHFKNFIHKEKVPFALYADIECILKDMQIRNAYQEHEAYSIGYYLKCNYDDSLSHYSSYRGK